MHLFAFLLSPIPHLLLFAPLEGNSPARSPYTFHGVSPGSLTSAPEERLYVCPVIRHFVLSESGGANPCRWEGVQVRQLWGFTSDSRELSSGSCGPGGGWAFGGKEAVEGIRLCAIRSTSGYHPHFSPAIASWSFSARA